MIPLSKLVPINILGQLSIEVKSCMPFTFICPLCSGKATAYDDVAHGHWIHCDKCGFSGESLELYRQTTKHTSLSAALSDLMSKSAIDVRPVDTVVSRYEALYSKWRALAKISRTACSRLCGTNLEPPMISLLTKYCLYTGWNTAAWPKTMGRYIGGMLQSDMQNNPILSGVTMKACGAALFIRMEDALGRISAGYFLTEHDAMARNLCYAGQSMSMHSDDGFLFLDAVINEDKVIICTDILTAIQMQLRNAATSTRMLPLAACSPHTSVSWELLSGKKIVIWSPEIDATLIGHTNYSPDCKVFTANTPHGPSYTLSVPGDRYDYVRHRNVDEIVEACFKQAKPWALAVAEHLLDNKDNARHLAAAGALSAGVRGAVLATCADDTTKSDLATCFDSIPIRARANTKGQLIVDKSDGWHKVERRLRGGPRGDKVVLTRLSNAKMAIDRVTSFITTKRLRYDGTIALNGKQATFQEWDVEDMSDRAFMAWLRSFAIERQMGYPVISNVKDFRDFVRETSTPVMTVGHDRAGLTARGLVCKDFIISSGEIPPVRLSDVFVGTRGPVRAMLDQPILCGTSAIALAVSAAALSMTMDKLCVFVCGDETITMRVLARVLDLPLVSYSSQIKSLREASQWPLLSYNAIKDETCLVQNRYRGGIPQLHAFYGKPCVYVSHETEVSGVVNLFAKFVCWLQKYSQAANDFQACLEEFPRFAAGLLSPAIIDSTMSRFTHMWRSDLRFFAFALAARHDRANVVYTKTINGKLYVVVDMASLCRWSDRTGMYRGISRAAVADVLVKTPHYDPASSDSVIKFRGDILTDYKETLEKTGERIQL